VVTISGSQHKVMKDDLVLSNYLEGYDINDQVVFDGVMMIGTKDFTMIGRPWVTSAKVYATVEEQTETDKTIVFKKRRRTTYQKTMQFAHKITVLRINDIELNIKDDLLAKAVAL
jgi:large subunit ribosomal protein L21